ncbi:hypothetical protein C8R48DRAFT_780431 [Suillus tomentosus]|nr:hypothetical protein C8R48DRAFT_780431 [Suillus tomentosus]
MHSLLLGIILCQWFNSWIKKIRQRTITAGVSRELDHINLYLSKFENPSWVARLPDQVGYPAGGSLTSDEWKCLSLVFGPIVIHEDIGSNCLILSVAFKIVFGRTFKDSNIPQAKHLLHEHLIQFIKIYPIDVKPMHHWLTHIFYPLRDNGPVYKFWTFLFERLNKILKSYSTNYHGAGELELGDILAAETLADENDVSRLVVDCIRLMLATEGDTLGTVASLGLHTEQSSVDGEPMIPKHIYTDTPTHTLRVIFYLGHKGLPHEIIRVDIRDIAATMKDIAASQTAGISYTVPAIQDPNTGIVVHWSPTPM